MSAALLIVVLSTDSTVPLTNFVVCVCVWSSPNDSARCDPMGEREGRRGLGKEGYVRGGD